MIKVVKKDYPWTIIIEDKISKKSGKKYQSICVIFTEIVDKDAKNLKDKYKMTYFNLFDERDLLKLASSSENAYQCLKYEREHEKEEEKQSKQQSVKSKHVYSDSATYNGFEDNIPF